MITWIKGYAELLFSPRIHPVSAGLDRDCPNSPEGSPCYPSQPPCPNHFDPPRVIPPALYCMYVHYFQFNVLRKALLCCVCFNFQCFFFQKSYDELRGFVSRFGIYYFFLTDLETYRLALAAMDARKGRHTRCAEGDRNEIDPTDACEEEA